MTRWCVTGRTIPRLALEQKIRASPPLTHPTQLPEPLKETLRDRISKFTLCSRFPIPDSRFPIPDSRF
ncbi:MAG: hypothetical protein F6J90_29620 [Moorea sp. SIOASIH]|uniref:hypothetical protein n=1 Tax=Moorena sp. SIOASIH TaxID=2607817 RepID=UPI0013BD98DD|nr:hypothetical protein [Moorena sp. SIOASIH]NEO40280.1 hypothetical protein [Moorena sp. SIOASIH]